MTERPKRGRPTKYREEYVQQAQRLCEMGHTDEEIASVLGVCLRTILVWRSKYPDFMRAFKAGKEPADDRVERALYSRAVGYSVEEEKIFQYGGKIIRAKTMRHYPPDPTSCAIWLNNRRSDRWRSKPEQASDNGEDIARAIAAAYEAIDADL